MKRAIYFSAVLLMFMAFSVSCKKKESGLITHRSKNLSFDDQYNVATDGKMLIFNSVAAYEAIVNNPTEDELNSFVSYISNLDYISYDDKLKADLSKTDYVNDEFLANVLNEDMIFQIQGYIYKVNIKTGKVFVLASEFSNEYNDLKIEKLSNDHIRVFNTEDDVIYLAESGAASTEKSCGGIGGGDYYCYSTIQGSLVYDPSLSDNSNYRIRPYVSMFCGGVIFKLKAGYKTYLLSNNGNSITELNHGLLRNNFGDKVVLYVKEPKGWYRKRPCNGNQDLGTYTSGEFHSSSYYKSEKNFYSGSRNLNGYYFYINARIFYAGQNGQVYGVSGFSPWGGRNINSPY